MREPAPVGASRLFQFQGRELGPAQSRVHTRQSLVSPGQSLRPGARKEGWEALPPEGLWLLPWSCAFEASAPLKLLGGAGAAGQGPSHVLPCGDGSSRTKPGEHGALPLWGDPSGMPLMGCNCNRVLPHRAPAVAP